jgi:hypothetical protein
MASYEVLPHLGIQAFRAVPWMQASDNKGIILQHRNTAQRCATESGQSKQLQLLGCHPQKGLRVIFDATGERPLKL